MSKKLRINISKDLVKDVKKELQKKGFDENKDKDVDKVIGYVALKRILNSLDIKEFYIPPRGVKEKELFELLNSIEDKNNDQDNKKEEDKNPKTENFDKKRIFIYNIIFLNQFIHCGFGYQLISSAVFENFFNYFFAGGLIPFPTFYCRKYFFVIRSENIKLARNRFRPGSDALKLRTECIFYAVNPYLFFKIIP